MLERNIHEIHEDNHTENFGHKLATKRLTDSCQNFLWATFQKTVCLRNCLLSCHVHLVRV